MLKIKLFVIILIIINISLVVTSDENTENNEDRLKTFPKKILARRREEHLVLLKNIAKNPKYEWRFRLVEVGVKKVFELINENRVKLKEEKDEDKLSQAKMLIIENTCLLMDFIVNFNQDIYKIFNIVSKKNSDTDWRAMLKISFEFLSNDKDLLDELTSKEYDFIMDHWEKINNEETLPEYPYENNIKRDINVAERIYQDESEKLKALKKKEKKKLKKGPSLRGVEL